MTTSSPLSEQLSPPYHLLRQQFRDFDELAKTVHGWGLDWVQLDRGPLDAAIHQVATPTALLSRFRFSRKFHQRGTSPGGVRTFGLIGELSPEIEWRGSRGTVDHLMVFPADDLFEIVSQPGFHGDTVSIPEDHVRSVAETMGHPDPLEGLAGGLLFVEVDRRRQLALRQAISRFQTAATARSDSFGDPKVLAELECDIVAALVAVLQSGLPSDGTPPEPTLRARAIRTALEYIEHHADEPPTVQDVCQTSGVSWRTLDYAFRDRFGVTPKQYLQATRLKQVRHGILNSEPETSILEIAAQWGFWHMGQFAKDYRRQFGELPSETIKRVVVPE